MGRTALPELVGSADLNLVPVRRSALHGAAFVLLAASAVVVLVATAATSSARFSAQTENESNFWQAARLELDVDSRQDLFLDGTNLYPGLELENCFVVTYTGSANDVSLMLHATGLNGSIDRYFELRIEVGNGVDTGCSDFSPIGEPAFEGTLRSFIDRHGSFGSGLILGSDIDDGDRVTVRASGALRDDNRAQGQTGRFIATLEVRP
jgi:hypothetical protein